MQKKNWLILGVVVIVLGVGGWLLFKPYSSSSSSSSSSAIGKKVGNLVLPKISIMSFAVSDISKEQIQLSSKMMLTNNLPATLKGSNLKYEIYVDSLQVIKDAYEKPIIIKPQDSITIDLPLTIQTQALKTMLDYFETENIDSADYTIKATFYLDVPIAGKRQFDINTTKRLPAVQPPEMKVQDIDLNGLKLKKSGVDLVMQVHNPNVFPLKLKDGEYNLTIEDDLKTTGIIKEVVYVPAESTQYVNVHMDVDKASLPKVGWKFLFRKEQTHFTYAFKGTLMASSNIIHNSTIAYSIKGTLDELKTLKQTIK